jgi:putative RecB family exonuclease
MEIKMEEKELDLILSASRVSTYKTCPRKYYYNYIEELPRLNWDHLDLGTFVHGVLELFHENFRSDNDKKYNLNKVMKESFQKFRTKMEKDKKLKDHILLEARDILKAYLRKIKKDGIGSKIISLEGEFELKLSDRYGIRGVIDRLDKDNDGVWHIKDYKTNKNEKYMKPFQLSVYGIYLLDKYKNIDMFRGSYIMLRFDSMLISYNFNKEFIEKTRKSLIEYSNRITEEERWISKPSKLCDWCDFKLVCLNSW